MWRGFIFYKEISSVINNVGCDNMVAVMGGGEAMGFDKTCFERSDPSIEVKL